MNGLVWIFTHAPVTFKTSSVPRCNNGPMAYRVFLVDYISIVGHQNKYQSVFEHVSGSKQLLGIHQIVRLSHLTGQLSRTRNNVSTKNYQRPLDTCGFGRKLPWILLSIQSGETRTTSSGPRSTSWDAIGSSYDQKDTEGVTTLLLLVNTTTSVSQIAYRFIMRWILSITEPEQPPLGVLNTRCTEVDIHRVHLTCICIQVWRCFTMPG